MKLLKLLLLIPAIFLSFLSYAQNVKVLEYDLQTRTFNGVLPFDQPFNLKIKNIDTEAVSIVARLLEVSKADYKKIVNGRAKNEVLPPDIYYKNANIVFKSDSLIKDVDYVGTEVIIPMPYYLKPDSKYFFDIGCYRITQLSDNLKKDLKADIISNFTFKNIINTAAKESLLDPGKSSKHWSKLVDTLNKKARQIVQSKNKKYVIQEADFTTQLFNFSSLLSSFTNLNKILNDFETNIKTKNKKAEATLIDSVFLKKQTSKLLRELSSADWMIFGVGADKQSDKFKKNSDLYFDSVATKDTSLKPTVDFARIELKELLNENIDTIAKMLDILIEDIIVANTRIQTLIASTHPESMIEQAKLHVTFDAGYSYIWGIDRGNTFVGFNIYFRAIDTTLPLKNYKIKFWDFVGSRTSLLIGTSIQSIKKDNVRKGLFTDDLALITGVGFRLLPWFKINGGAYLYYKYPPNPLVSKERYSFTGSPFISLSIDFNLRVFFSSFGNGAVSNNFIQR